MSIKIASMNFGDCGTILHNTPNGVKNIAEVLGPNGEVYWSSTKELTGIPPLSIRSNGTMLLDYLISGNITQTGTPTSTTPIQPQETGERTRQLIDYTQSESGGIDGSGNYVPANNLWRSTAYTPIDETLQYVVSWTANTNLNVVRINYYTSDKTYISRKQINTSGTALTIPQNAAYFKWTLYAKTDFIIDLSFVQSLQLMINTGSTPLSYENFGYKIPISSAGQTNNIYLGEVETTRKVKKLVLTGEEFVYVYANADIAFRINTSDALLNNRYCICTHFVYQRTPGGSKIDGITAGAGDYNLYFTFSSQSAAQFGVVAGDTNSFKSYLASQYAAGTPVTVWYVLATPETGIVNEPLRKIGNYADTVSYEQAGVQIPTNRGNTVIDVETTLKPSQMYIKYK